MNRVEVTDNDIKEIQTTLGLNLFDSVLCSDFNKWRQIITIFCDKLSIDVETGKAIKNVLENLPECYQVNIELGWHFGHVSLMNPDDENCDFASNHESLADEINDAVLAAIELDANNG